ncbi:MAG: BlaI/MecI/CopY family transcriptional regulator [Planctomycetes bacterium]|nr:BlaI/MecI/CopY family transcriptional regulator [Planctomycetota bacterium]
MSLTTGFRLGKRELEIMNLVWDMGEATVQGVCERLERRGAYSTVLTMMRTLERKGMLTHRVSGRTFIYRPQVTRDQVQGSMLRDMRELLFGGSATLMLSSMLSHERMTATELAELRRLLDQAGTAESPNP